MSHDNFASSFPYEVGEAILKKGLMPWTWSSARPDPCWSDSTLQFWSIGINWGVGVAEVAGLVGTWPQAPNYMGEWEEET